MYKSKVSYSIGGRMRLLLKDSSVLILSGNHGDPWSGVDVNAPDSKPNQLGRDLFLIKVYEDKILPLGTQGTFKKKKNGLECKCGKKFGLRTSPYGLAGPEGQGEIPSVGCCSAYFLKNYK